MSLTLQAFVDHWSGAQRAERTNYQLFLSERCEVLELPRPDPAGPDTAANAYVFERAVRLHRADGKVTTRHGRPDFRAMVARTARLVGSTPNTRSRAARRQTTEDRPGLTESKAPDLKSGTPRQARSTVYKTAARTEILATLAALGRARRSDAKGTYLR